VLVLVLVRILAADSMSFDATGADQALRVFKQRERERTQAAPSALGAGAGAGQDPYKTKDVA
jgi:hypothetical protein